MCLNLERHADDDNAYTSNTGSDETIHSDVGLYVMSY